MRQFELEPFVRLASGQLPGGYRQRLAMAAALLHEPEILFLDEPTSGADPLARREFWRRITALAEQGVEPDMAKLGWMVGLHLTFVVSGVLMAVMDWVGQKSGH